MVAWFEGLFEPYRCDCELVCFLCDAALPPPPTKIYANVVGDLADAEKCVAVPLCAGCGALPQMVRWNRVLKTLRTMHKAKTGKNVHYQLRRY